MDGGGPTLVRIESTEFQGELSHKDLLRQWNEQMELLEKNHEKYGNESGDHLREELKKFDEQKQQLLAPVLLRIREILNAIRQITAETKGELVDLESELREMGIRMTRIKNENFDLWAAAATIRERLESMNGQPGRRLMPHDFQ